MVSRVLDSRPLRWARSFFDAGPGVLASAVAFNLFFALVPTLIAVLSAASLLGRSATTIEQAQETLSQLLPRSAARFLTDILDETADYLGEGTGWVIVGSLIVALWAGARGSLTLISALARIEGEAETRPWWRLRLIGMGLTGLFALTLLVTSIVLVAGERIGVWLGDLAPWIEPVTVLATPVAGLVILGFLVAFYRWGPPQPLPGAVLASVLSTIGVVTVALGMRWVLPRLNLPPSLSFLGGVAILLLWLYIVAWVMLASASSAATWSRRRADA